MSATLSNGAELAAWLGAILHVSDYRPVPLDERVLVRSRDVNKSYESAFSAGGFGPRSHKPWSEKNSWIEVVIELDPGSVRFAMMSKR